jgi:hypothetical protein
MFSKESGMSKATSEAAKVVGSQPGPFTRALTAASAAAQDAYQKDLQSKLIELQSKSTSTAAAYDNAVMLGGYLAFFALWSGVQQSVTITCRLVTVGMMGVSLVCYLGWQILQMVTRQWFEWKLLDVFKAANEPAKFNCEWERVSHDYGIATAKTMRFWPWLFIPALVFGITAGITLSYNALAVVFGWSQLTG